MSNRSLIVLFAVFAGFLLLNGSLYVVKETERAVLLQFGEVIKADVPPGLHVKIPFMHKVRKFDARIMTLDAQAERFLTLEKKSLIVDSYAKWRVEDVKKYYTATNGEESRTNALLAQRINDGLRNEIGERDMHEVVSGKRDQLMKELREGINKVALAELGIIVIDIRVKQVDLPEDVRQSVFDRMTTERQRLAREHRSRGQEMAEGIRAAADREKIIIESQAYSDAEILRGSGDAQAAAIYAKAYSRNPEFYQFWRSLSAYEETFSSKSDLMLIEPDSEFFRYLKSARPK